jgi:type II secretory pathway pseudopilin PulG
MLNATTRDQPSSIPRARGFTYVGLMIVIAIIALASIATLTAGSALQRRMNEEELLFVGTQFANAFRSYFEATPVGQRNYPAKLEELLRDPRYPGVRRHLRRIYIDPITGNAEWGLVAAPGGIIGVHSLSQETPLKTSHADPTLAALSDKKSYAEWAFGFLPPGVVPSGTVSLAGTLAAPVSVPGAKPGAPPAAPPAPTDPFLKPFGKESPAPTPIPSQPFPPPPAAAPATSD